MLRSNTVACSASPSSVCKCTEEGFTSEVRKSLRLKSFPSLSYRGHALRRPCFAASASHLFWSLSSTSSAICSPRLPAASPHFNSSRLPVSLVPCQAIAPGSTYSSFKSYQSLSLVIQRLSNPIPSLTASYTCPVYLRGLAYSLTATHPPDCLTSLCIRQDNDAGLYRHALRGVARRL